MQAISFISFVTKVRFSASHPFCFFYGVTMLLEAKKKKKKKSTRRWLHKRKSIAVIISIDTKCNVIGVQIVFRYSVLRSLY